LVLVNSVFYPLSFSLSIFHWILWQLQGIQSFLLFTHTFLAIYTNYSSLAFLILFLQFYCLFLVLVSTNTLFINIATLLLFTRSLRILFIIVWNIAGEFVIPKNITVGSNNSICVINAFFYSSSFLILTLLKLHHKSIFVNTFLLSILSIKSIINDNR